MTQSAQKSLRDYLQETEDAISKGRMDNAESNCQHILAQFPESLEAQRLLGEIYLAKEAMKEAQQAFDWVLTNDPENVIAYCDRALISERQGDYDTSLDCYQQAYELSRGNNKIRQEFNKLSQKAGQQGFMLSRAGLARLYMRGDLLTQAIQEWEAVLATTPERLDARTGLLETYWREGLYERVEQLAAQILQDVPGCE
ncbi:MAG TPA: tetratricopeptide repeat protein, partial [Ktedonobacteraceae bacterium]